MKPALQGGSENPWLAIPLADYESHMALPQVGQAQLLADLFEGMLREYAPASVAVLGCAGGNGFERISSAVTRRVVGVDLNAAYIAQLSARFGARVANLELIVGDIQRADVSFAPVEFVFAALLFEYVDVPIVLERIRSLLVKGGVLGTVVQLPNPEVPSVTPSPYGSLQALAPIMRLVIPEELKSAAEQVGLHEVARWRAEALGGKRFEVQLFQLSAN